MSPRWCEMPFPCMGPNKIGQIGSDKSKLFLDRSKIDFQFGLSSKSEIQ